MIGVFVRLSAEALHRGALADVEHTDLQGGLVGVSAHFSAQSVDFAHEVPLRRAADGGIAGHEADAVEIERQHDRIHSRPRQSESRLTARVAGSDDDGVRRIFDKFFHNYCFRTIFLMSSTSLAIFSFSRMSSSILSREYIIVVWSRPPMTLPMEMRGRESISHMR